MWSDCGSNVRPEDCQCSSGGCACIVSNCIFLLQLGDVMVDISSNLMLADERVLWMAQKEARACSRIVECLQRIPVLRLSNGALAYSTVSTKIISSVKHYDGFVRIL